jgi:hypothetical protein
LPASSLGRHPEATAEGSPDGGKRYKI